MLYALQPQLLAQLVLLATRKLNYSNYPVVLASDHQINLKDIILILLYQYRNQGVTPVKAAS